MKAHFILVLTLLALGLSGCTGLAPGITPVSDFNKERYLGTWYEIARLDHSFERGLSRVTANYSVREDGGIRVINRGYSEKGQGFDEAEGKAYFVGEDSVGHLKVSFFGPFYGSYVVFYLEDYNLSYVGSSSHDYLWLLSRTPTISEQQKQHFLSTIKEAGYDANALIWVEQNAN